MVIGGPPLDPDASPAQRRRFRRDVAIVVCVRAGLSHRWVAEAFGIPTSRVGQVVKKINAALGPEREATC